MNPFDEIAVEEAVRLKEKGARTEVVVVSIGPAKAQETIRTALAIGADRGILIETPEGAIVEPLAVAKLLKAVVDAEKPGLVILGKQAIDDDCNQTGQMLAALLGWPQATFASKVVLDGGARCRHARGRRRPRDGEAQDAGRRDDRPAPQRAALSLAAQHHEGQEEAARRQEARRLGVDIAPRLKVLKTAEPPGRKAGVKVGSVAELVAKLKTEAGVL